MNFISKITSLKSKDIAILTLTVLSLILVFYNIKTKNELNKLLTKKDIEGTYIMQNGNISESEYFTFIENSFYRYKQLELLDEGTYENVYDNVYIIKSDNIYESAIYSNEKFYFYDKKQKDVLIYSKISHIPTFININPKIKR